MVKLLKFKVTRVVSPKDRPARAQVPAADDELPQRLVDFKRKVETGEVAPLTSFYLSNDKFTRSQAKIEGNFRRFDCDSRRQRITFRMPSPTHETFTQSLVSAIHVKLFLQGCQSQQVHDFIAKINTVGSAKVVLHHDDNAPGSHRQPDAQFPYKGSESTVSVWKPRLLQKESSDVSLKIEQAVQSQPFRSADGSPINQTLALDLSLHDFAPDQLCQDCPDLSLSIPYSKLYEMLSDAEEVEDSTTTGILPNRGVKRDRLSSSSLESLISEDKEKWQVEDRAVKEKQDANDGEYKGADDEAHLPSVLNWRVSAFVLQLWTRIRMDRFER
ncbi:uncharacterized protein BKA55DRAFT_544598 [Fusarium redolens]|uniref:Uncharacterized protein n=1 Tax=Fusarium redolens TaxID=48865 RepID=A0A9P9JU43_FUSRE|nr:uncharacterized protein BKA55DRAFT_544598 [Fusarium redolens]KAH7232260.1 hypothetical protein BKA55DRAFT_544598 [Fusarium redolens]